MVKKPRSKRSRSKKPSQLNHQLSTKPSENPSMISLKVPQEETRKRRKPENPKESKELKPQQEKDLIKTQMLPLISKLMLPTISLLELVPTLWVSVLSKWTMEKVKPCHQEVEEVEEAAEVEVIETHQEKEDKEDKIQSKPSRKPKKISQPYEREDLFDLPSKELADSTMANNRLLIVLKRFL